MITNNLKKNIIETYINENRNESINSTLPNWNYNGMIGDFDVNDDSKIISYFDWIIIFHKETGLEIYDKKGRKWRKITSFNYKERTYNFNSIVGPTDIFVSENGIIYLVYDEKNYQYFIQFEDIINLLPNTFSLTVSAANALYVYKFPETSKRWNKFKILQSDSQTIHLIGVYNTNREDDTNDAGFSFSVFDMESENKFLYKQEYTHPIPNKWAAPENADTKDVINYKKWRDTLFGVFDFNAVITNHNNAYNYKIVLTSKSGKRFSKTTDFSTVDEPNEKKRVTENTLENYKAFAQEAQNSSNVTITEEFWSDQITGERVHPRDNVKMRDVDRITLHRSTSGGGSTGGGHGHGSATTYYTRYRNKQDQVIMELSNSSRCQQEYGTYYRYYCWNAKGRITYNFQSKNDVMIANFTVSESNINITDDDINYLQDSYNNTIIDVNNVAVANNKFYLCFKRNGMATWDFVEIDITTLNAYPIANLSAFNLAPNVIVCKDWSKLTDYGDTVLVHYNKSNGAIVGTLFKQSSNEYDRFHFTQFTSSTHTYIFATAIREQNLISLYILNKYVSMAHTVTLSYNNSTPYTTPYFFQPYNNNLQNFLAVRIQGLKNNKVMFDGNITDLPIYNNNVVFSSLIDKHSMNDETVNQWNIISNTNNTIMSFNETKTKNNNTNLKLNFDTVISVVDKVDNKNNVKQSASNDMTKMFIAQNDSSVFNQNKIAYFLIWKNNNSTPTRYNVRPSYFRKSSDDLTGYFRISIIHNNSIINKISLYNYNNNELCTKTFSLKSPKNVNLSLKFRIENN